jgi:hypothetical protein
MLPDRGRSPRRVTTASCATSASASCLTTNPCQQSTY